ncbi:MAG: hypothetical protein IJY28_10570 [Clostridia bacterium]|nr:hypothetical protein [Clostridia bacterium]
MEKWRKISLIGILLGYSALLIDYFVISVPYAIMIPLLMVSIVLIFAGLIQRRKQKKNETNSN